MHTVNQDKMKANFSGLWAYWKWQMQRSWYLVLIPSLVQFLLQGLPLLLRSGNRPGAYMITVNYSLLFLLNLLFVVIIVHRLFSFLHKSESANFTFALPLTRSSIYFCLLSVYFLLILFMRGLSFVQNIFVFSDFIPEILKEEAFVLILLLASAAFLSYFYTEAANGFNAQTFALAINILWPLFYLSVHIYGSSYLYGFAMRDWSLLLSPYFTGITQGFSPGKILYWLCFTLVFVLLAFLHFHLRPAEKSGRYEEGSKNYLFVKFLAAIVAALLFAYILHELRNRILARSEADRLILFIGLVCGVLLSSMVLDLVFMRGRVKFFPSFARACLGLIPVLVILAVFATGAFGYTRRLPDVDDTKELELSSRKELGGTFIPSYYRGIHDEQDPISLTLRDKDQIAGIKKLMERQYCEENPGLKLPHNILSMEKSEGYLKENYGEPFSYKMAVRWQEEGRPFSFIRYIPFYAEPEGTVLSELTKDPALALFFHHYGQRTIVNDYYFESGQDGGGKKTCDVEHKVNDPWFITLRNFSYMPRYYAREAEILHALLKDYMAMSREEREALYQSSDYVLVIEGYYLEDAALLPLAAEAGEAGLAEEDSAQIQTTVICDSLGSETLLRQEREIPYRLRLPFTEDADQLKDYLDSAYEAYQNEKRNEKGLW